MSTLRDQINQKQRPLRLCVIAGLAMMLPAFLLVVLHRVGLADPPGGGYFGLLVMLAAVGFALLLLSLAFARWSVRCPKCRAFIGEGVSAKEKYCRYCGADFDAEV